jgi:ABC-type amino acid transport substrate-binding protein
LNTIGKDTNCRIEFINIPWENQLIQLSKGKIDIVVNASKNKQREKYILFLSPYINNKSVMFMKKTDIPNIFIEELLQIKKIANFLVGITRGYSYGPSFEEAESDPQFLARTVTSISEELTIQKLINGEVNAILGNPLVIGYYFKQHGLDEKFGIYNLDLNSSEENYGYIGYSRKSMSKEKAVQIDTIIKYYIKTGTLENIIDKYIDKETARTLVP